VGEINPEDTRFVDPDIKTKRIPSVYVVANTDGILNF